MNTKFLKILIPTSVILVAIFLYFNFYIRELKNSQETTSQSKTVAEQAEPIVENKDSEKPEEIKLLFLGDLMFDRYIRQVASQKGNNFIFEPVAELLQSSDLAVANLEGPITASSSKSIYTKVEEKGHFIFTFDPSVADTLKKYNIGLVNVGNNHILNFSANGLGETRNYLEKAGIDYFGDPENEAHWLAIKNMNGLKVAFVSYNQFAKNATRNILNDIAKARTQADIVIVYTHWGTEYAKSAADNIKNLAHTLIDSGADLIIGSHPHVVQPKEEYQSRRIYYSLGNFVFDQYFSQDTQKGLAVEVTINPENRDFSFQEIPLVLKSNGQTALQEK